jgi:hypothetical protein
MFSRFFSNILGAFSYTVPFPNFVKKIRKLETTMKQKNLWHMVVAPVNKITNVTMI